MVTLPLIAKHLAKYLITELLCRKVPIAMQKYYWLNCTAKILTAKLTTKTLMNNYEQKILTIKIPCKRNN